MHLWSYISLPRTLGDITIYIKSFTNTPTTAKKTIAEMIRGVF
jgi:hypothetical protein